MRVFTDGACSANGRPGAKAGYAVWFPEHRELSMSARIPDEQPQTNQRAELTAIYSAVCTLESQGFLDEDIVIYTDSDYSINCLTKWIPGWVSRGWKTTEGKSVLHQDILKDLASKLSKFKSHRFVHVRAHTGNEDDLSKNNDIVDRMARATIDDTVRIVEPPALDDLYPGCPLRVMGPPVTMTEVTDWIRSNLNALDRATVDKYLLKVFTELCKAKDITLTKQTIQKRTMLRAERTNLQISHSIKVEKLDE